MQRYGLYRLQLGRYVLSHQPVPSGRALQQYPLFIDQLDSQSIQLGLCGIGQLLIRLQVAVNFIFKSGQFIGIEDIVQAEHGIGMFRRRKPIKRGAPHPQAWRVRGNQFRKLLLKRQQLMEHPVILTIGNNRIIQNIVPMRMIGQLLTKVLQPQPGRIDIHSAIVRPAVYRPWQYFPVAPHQ